MNTMILPWFEDTAPLRLAGPPLRPRTLAIFREQLAWVELQWRS